MKRDLGDCQHMHRTVMSLFPPAGPQARAQYGVLHRLEESRTTGELRLYVQSRVIPNWSNLPADYLLAPPACKELSPAYAAIRSGMLLRFRLLANTTKRERVAEGSNQTGGRRIMLTDESDQLWWLRRHAKAGGFELAEVAAAPGVPDVMSRVASDSRMRGHHASGQLSFGAVLFEGRLRVTDPDRFLETLLQGVGSAKAYGFGLLSVASGVR